MTQHTTRTRTYIVCDDCGPAIVNDDWTHLDNMDREEADRAHASTAGWLEIVGWLSPDGKGGGSGYFTCPCCDEIGIGPGVRMIGGRS